MAEEFRFKKRAAGPEFESSDELVLWAHDDGSLRTTDDDGQESTVGAGEQGEPGVGVPVGGTTAQVLAKATDADFDTEWVAAPEGGSQTYVPVALTDVDVDGPVVGVQWTIPADFLFDQSVLAARVFAEWTSGPYTTLEVIVNGSTPMLLADAVYPDNDQIVVPFQLQMVRNGSALGVTLAEAPPLVPNGSWITDTLVEDPVDFTQPIVVEIRVTLDTGGGGNYWHPKQAFAFTDPALPALTVESLHVTGALRDLIVLRNTNASLGFEIYQGDDGDVFLGGNGTGGIDFDAACEVRANTVPAFRAGPVSGVAVNAIIPAAAVAALVGALANGDMSISADPTAGSEAVVFTLKNSAGNLVTFTLAPD